MVSFRGQEPTEVGVDIMAGSLIKNPGGGIVPSGGYIAGKRFDRENILQDDASGFRPGGRCHFGTKSAVVPGLFPCSHVVAESLKELFYRPINAKPWVYYTSGTIRSTVRYNSGNKVQ